MTSSAKPEIHSVLYCRQRKTKATANGSMHRKFGEVWTSAFYARQRSYSAYMLWQFRLSVCPSVTRVDQSKTVEARITQFSPYSSPIPLVFRG